MPVIPDNRARWSTVFHGEGFEGSPEEEAALAAGQVPPVADPEEE
jgi:hypothetical protein